MPSEIESIQESLNQLILLHAENINTYEMSDLERKMNFRFDLAQQFLNNWVDILQAMDAIQCQYLIYYFPLNNNTVLF